MYYYTCVKDSNILVVFDVIAVENNGGKVKRYSKGWAFFRPFTSDDVVDVGTNKESSTQRYTIILLNIANVVFEYKLGLLC